MKNSYKIMMASVLGLSLSACAPRVNISFIPLTGGAYSIQATSSDAQAAREGALKQAQTVCVGQGKSYEVIKIDSKYNGVDKNVVVIANFASKLSGDKSQSSSPFASEKRDTDYEVNLDFQCR